MDWQTLTKPSLELMRVHMITLRSLGEVRADIILPQVGCPAR